MAEPASKMIQIQNNPQKWIVETSKHVTNVIFPRNSYIWDDLCFKRDSQFTINSELFYTIEYDQIKNSRKGTAKKYLELLYSQLGIEETQRKPPKKTKKEAKIEQKTKNDVQLQSSFLKDQMMHKS
ncbi:hypothetical protein ABPG72_014432 [Tetrahymena utriculariae]